MDSFTWRDQRHPPKVPQEATAGGWTFPTISNKDDEGSGRVESVAKAKWKLWRWTAGCYYMYPTAFRLAKVNIVCEQKYSSEAYICTGHQWT